MTSSRFPVHLPRCFASASILAALTSLACRGPGEPGDRTTAAITNGRPASEDPAVVAVLAGQEPVCTGTLVDQRLVLTAAHCLLYKPTAVLFDGLPAAVPIATVGPHQSYDRRSEHFDLAMLVLATAVTTIPPVALEKPSVLALRIGTELRMVGFGGDAEGSGQWEKQQGSATIAVMDADSIELTGDSRPCNGDAGGPALVDRGAGTEYIAGVISRSDLDCANRSVLSRVDSQFDGFIKEYDRLASSVGLPARARCLSDANCASGLCATAVSSRTLATCSHECTTDGDCGERGFVCDLSARLCRSALAQNRFLASCQTDGECDSLLCAGATLGGPRFCTRSCRQGDSGSCDSSSSCLRAEDSAEPFVCLPKSAPPSARLGTGCSLSAARAGGGPPFDLALTLLAVGLTALVARGGRRRSRP